MPAQGEPENKPSRLGGLHIEAGQKVPELRNNGSATETKARIKMGSGGSPGLWNLTDLVSLSASPCAGPVTLDRLTHPFQPQCLHLSNGTHLGLVWWVVQ